MAAGGMSIEIKLSRPNRIYRPNVKTHTHTVYFICFDFSFWVLGFDFLFVNELNDTWDALLGNFGRQNHSEAFFFDFSPRNSTQYQWRSQLAGK